jgi:hypothetical protein
LLRFTHVQSYERRFKASISGGRVPYQVVFGSERPTGALLDRLTRRVHILEMNSESDRLRHSLENAADQETGASLERATAQTHCNLRAGRSAYSQSGKLAMCGLPPAIKSPWA